MRRPYNPVQTLLTLAARLLDVGGKPLVRVLPTVGCKVMIVLGNTQHFRYSAVLNFSKIGYSLKGDSVA